MSRRAHRTLALAALLAGTVMAQEVHVQPRPRPEQKQLPSSDSALKTHTKPFISNVDVVLVPVTVTDPLTRVVTGLAKSNFRVLDDDKQQDIEFFYTQDAPVSVGIVFDCSGSVGWAINESREAVKDFMKASNADDEFFLVTFADKPQLAKDFTDSPEQIERTLLFTSPYGWTGLWDAVYLGLSKMRAATHPRKVLLIVSDGGENNSRHNARELRRFVLESDVQIYGVGVPGADYDTREVRVIANATGGRTFEGPPKSYAVSLTKIAVELRNQYVLGYRPKHLARDGKFHRIRVKLQPPPGLPPLTVSVKKTGYYAADQ